MCLVYQGGIIITPFLFISIFSFLAILGLKYFHPTMAIVTNIIAIVSPFEFGAWLYFMAAIISD